jgi:hypothetical protein
MTGFNLIKLMALSGARTLEIPHESVSLDAVELSVRSQIVCNCGSQSGTELSLESSPTEMF